MVYKRVTQWLDLWAELPCIKLCCGGAGIYNVHVQERHLKYILLSRSAKYCEEILCRGNNVMSLKVRILKFSFHMTWRSQISGCYQGQCLILSDNTLLSVFDFRIIHSLIQ